MSSCLKFLLPGFFLHHSGCFVRVLSIYFNYYLFVLFLYMKSLFTCMSVYHMFAWCLQGALDCLELELWTVVSGEVEPRSSERTHSAPNFWDTSPYPSQSIFISIGKVIKTVFLPHHFPKVPPQMPLFWVLVPTQKFCGHIGCFLLLWLNTWRKDSFCLTVWRESIVWRDCGSRVSAFS